MKKSKEKRRAATPNQMPPEGQPERKRANLFRLLAWGGFASLVLGFCAYEPALKGPFIFDDFALPFRNPAFRGESFLDWINTVRPVLMSSYWMNFQISGRDSTLSYHLINLVIHCLNALLVGAIILKLLLPAGLSSFSAARRDILLAVFAAGVFLFHPLQTESVAYIAGRSESLSAFFCLAALTVFLYRRRPAISWTVASAVLVLFAAAAATKEHAVALVGILVLTDFFLYRGISLEPIRRNWRLYAPLGVGAGLAVAAAFWVLQRSDSAGFGLTGLPWNHYFFSQLRAWLFYVQLFLFPAGLTVDHDFAVSTTLWQHGSALAGMFWIAAVSAAIMCFRKYPLAGYGLLFYLILLAPTSSVVPIKDLVAERRMYLPMIGLILVALEALRSLRMPMVSGSVALGCIVVILALTTYERNKAWADPVRLWNDAIAVAPAKARPYGNLASHYLTQRKCVQAAEVADRAFTTIADKNDAYLLTTWGLALDCMGEKKKAIEKLEAAAALRPSAEVYAALGRIHLDLGQLPEADKVLALAEQVDPRSEMTYVYRGLLHFARNQPEAAAEEFRRALAVNPRNAAARELLSGVHTRTRLAY